MKNILLFVFCTLTSTQIASQEIFIFHTNAYREYAKVIESPSIWQWIDDMGYTNDTKTFTDNFCPEPDNLHWVRYFHVASGLVIWFRVLPSEQAEAMLLFEKEFLNHPKITPYRNEIVITPVTIQRGVCLRTAEIAQIIKGYVALQDQKNSASRELQSQLRKLKDVIEHWRKEIENPKTGEARINKIIEDIEKAARQIEKAKKGLGGGLSETFDKIRHEAGLPDGNGRILSDGHAGPGQMGKEDGNSGGKNKGLGDLPIPSSIPRWVQLAHKIALKVIGYIYGVPWLKDAVYKALMLSYMIAPDIVEAVDSFYARIHDLMYPDDFEDLMNSATDVYLKARKYIEFLDALYNIYQSNGFQELLNGNFDFETLGNLPLTTVLDLLDKSLDKAGMGIPDDVKKVLDAVFQGINFKDIKNIDVKKMQDWALKQAEKKGIEMAEKKLSEVTNMPIDARGFMDCIKTHKCEEWAKKQGKSVVERAVPEKYKPYVNDIIDGDYKRAAQNFVYDEVRNHLGIDPRQLEQAWGLIRSNEYKAAVRLLAADYKHKFGACQGLVDQVLQDENCPEATAKEAITCLLRTAGKSEAAEAIDQYGLDTYEYMVKGRLQKDLKDGLEKIKNLDPKIIEKILSRSAEAGMIQLSHQMLEDYLGFTNNAAREAFLRGDIKEAIRLQMEAGGWQEIDYREVASSYADYLERRAFFLEALLRNLKIPVSKEEFESIARPNLYTPKN